VALLRILIAAFALFTATAAHAVQPDEILKDPALESRARALSKELRCMVCQNQSIDDSDAPRARDLRVLVRERLVAGDSDEKVLQFLTDRYGAFVLLKPQFNAETAVLWLAPLFVLLAGGIGLIAFLRRRRAGVPVAAGEGDRLTPAEQARITELMRQADK
jgi:cytochrome c-type biogenesis protein CcmH